MTDTTTQPDPQVVAWVVLPADMSIEWEPQIGLMLRDGTARMEQQRNADGSRTVTIRSVGRPARKPLTVADIPAGQGAASLFIGPGRYGELAVMYRTGLTHDHVFMTEGLDDPSEARRAMWEHLAATLPTIDTTEESK